MIGEFIKEYGMQIIFTLLTGIAGYIGLRLKKIFETKEIDETKKKVVKDCVKAVEQLYKDLKGDEKKQKAIENIVAMLDSKGIPITELEIEMLIESTVSEFNKAFKESEGE